MYLFSDLYFEKIRNAAWVEIQNNIRNLNVAKLAKELDYSQGVISDLMIERHGHTISNVDTSFSAMADILYKLKGAKKMVAIINNRRYVLSKDTSKIELLIYDVFKKIRMNHVGSTLKELQVSTGLHYGILSRIKRGELVSTRIDTCLRYLSAFGVEIYIELDDYCVKPPTVFRLQDKESPVTFLVASIKARGQAMYAENNMTPESLMKASGCNVNQVRSFLCTDSRIRQPLELTLRMAQACGVNVAVSVS